MEGTRQAEYRKGKLDVAELPGLKATLKRGALVAAANWPLVAVQFVAESTLKVLLAVPVVGGIFLVVLLLGANADELLAGDVREIVAQVFGAMRQNVAALVAFSVAFTIVLLGGSALTFVIKGGTVSLLADAEAQAGPIERPPFSVRAVRRANVVAIEPFLDGCQRLWRRYVRLGACLLGVYGGDRGALSRLRRRRLPARRELRSAARLDGCDGDRVERPDRLDHARQLLLSADADGGGDRGHQRAQRRAPRRCTSSRSTFREIAGIFGVVLLLAVIATVASIVATAGFGLINLIPILGLAVLPLQIAAWLVRGFVFQYLALAALGAYLTHYRHYAARHLGRPRRRRSRGARRFRGNGSHDELRQVSLPRRRRGCRSRRSAGWGRVLAQKRDIISFAPGYPAADTFPWAEFQEIARELLTGSDPNRAAVRTDARLPAAARGHRRHHGASAARPPRSNGSSSLPARSRASTSSRACSSIPATSCSWSCRPTPARSPPFATCRRRWSACRRRPTASTSMRSTTSSHGLVAAGPARPLPLRRAEFPEPDRPADRPAASAAPCSNGPRGATC